jgi:hypothetical protein
MQPLIWKAFVALLGIMLIAAGSVAAWAICTQGKPPEIVDTPQPENPVAPSAAPAKIAQAPVKEVPPATAAPAPSVDPPTVTAKDPARAEEPRPGEAPRGKAHHAAPVLFKEVMAELHAEAYRQFIAAPGNGRSREVPRLIKSDRPWKFPEWTSEELARETPPPADANDLSGIHRLSLNRFADSNAQGSSAAASPPAPKQQFWEIASLDLVGLVMHETPVVYLSKKVPQMKELKDSGMRDLDVFEMEGLAELQAGKNLYIRGKEGTIRVLGPINAGKACLKCHHDAKEGDMLGAFSYTLRVAEYRATGAPFFGQPFTPWNGKKSVLPRLGPAGPKG